MKIIDVQQGTPEWLAARAGKITASRIADIMRQTKSGVSATRATYMGELIAETLSGQPTPSFTTKAMEFGKETEAQARSTYAFLNDVEPVQVGLILHPTMDRGAASPDSLIGDEGLLEIKCPNSSTHIQTLRGAKIDPDYYKQMQWQLACTKRLWCDFVSFDPRMPAHMQMHTTRVKRDSTLIMEMESAVRVFLAEMDEMIADLNKLYPAPKQEAAE